MVVDCGGGTVDVTIHEVLGGGGLKEVEAASGDAMGSVSVDQQFKNLLRKIFSDKFIDFFKSKRPVGWVSFCRPVGWVSSSGRQGKFFRPVRRVSFAAMFLREPIKQWFLGRSSVS